MPKSIFKWDEGFYFPIPSQGYELYATEKEARKEFRRLRDIAHKREQRMKAAGLDKSQTYKQLREVANLRAKNVKTPSQLGAWLGRLEYILKKEETTVKGAKEYRKNSYKRVQKTLESHGYSIENLDDFGDFMEKFRAIYGRRYVSSDRPAELYETMEGLPFSADEIMQHFDEYIRDLDETKRIVEQYKREKPETSPSDYLLERLREL